MIVMSTFFQAVARKRKPIDNQKRISGLAYLMFHRFDRLAVV